MPYKDPSRRRAANREAVRRYQERHPDRVQENRRRQQKHYADDEALRARRLAQKAKARGDLAPEPCLFCDEAEVQMHHHDYSLPYDVTWLCARHHGIAHRDPIDTIKEAHT